VNHGWARAAGAVLLISVAGCALTLDSTRLGVPATLADAAATPPTGTPFSITKHPVFAGWGAFTVSPPNLEDVLAGQTGPGAGIAQLRIRVRARWSDLLVTALTFGFLSPRSVTFEGIVLPPAAPAAR
jgi:protein-S-isoprenylcysteine O-methyltransferase Ste14